MLIKLFFTLVLTFNLTFFQAAPQPQLKKPHPSVFAGRPTQFSSKMDTSSDESLPSLDALPGDMESDTDQERDETRELQAMSSTAGADAEARASRDDNTSGASTRDETTGPRTSTSSDTRPGAKVNSMI